MHRAARIAAAAHGGQVLISDETKVLSERALPETVGLKDLGDHRLKDLDRPEHLHQLVIEGLPSDFPPPRSLDAVRGNLREPLTSFVGREREIAELRALLLDHRLVTLTGPGGTGKTRLAIGLGQSLRAEFPGGAFFVALDPAHEAGLVPSLMAQALGLAETKELSPLEAVTEHLRERKLLLILDNFEQVSEAAPMVSGLLESAPEVRILVTSRSPIRQYGEQQYPVAPLRVPDLDRLPPFTELREYEAVRLFVDRARIAKPGFEVTEANAPTIAAITARLDGLPLAIELAAARTKLLPPPALLTRLEHRLATLSAGLESLPARQRTLRGAIEWSHESLADPERVLLRRLSVFAGGCALEAAESVCNPDALAGDDLLDTLSTLVDDSLLLQEEGIDGEPRFRLLETIREYAQERLAEAGEDERFARRHAEHITALAEAAEPGLIGKDQAASLERLAVEHDNIRAALRWATAGGDTSLGLRIGAAVWRFWQVRSHIREGRRWLGTLLAKPDAGADPAVRAKALTAAGGLAYWQGDLADARRQYEPALAFAREGGDPAMIGDGLRNLGFVAMATRDVPAAVGLFGEAVGYLETVGDRFALAEARASAGTSLWLAGDLAAARAMIAASREVMLELGVLQRAADTSMVLGVIDRRLGDLPESERLTRQSVEFVAQLSDQARAPLVLDASAALALARGQAPEAVRLAAAAAHLRATIGGTVPSFIVDIATEMATARRQLGNQAFDTAWAAGETLDSAGALGYALEVIDAAGRPGAG